MCRLTNVAFLLIVAAPLIVAIPDWLRASVVGCTWGALSLAGLAASWSGRRLLSGIYALCLAQLAQLSMQRIADLDHYAAWTLVIAVLGGGWIVGLLWTPWHAEHRQPVRMNASTKTGPRLARWSMWDIGCLATGVAVLSWVAPRSQAPLQLVCQIAPALVGGWFVSLLAVEWACRDQWSLGRMLAVVLGVPVACIGCLWLATTTSGLETLGWQAVLRWWLTGPGSVMAAQGLVVLGYLAAARADTDCASMHITPRSPR
ncbi:MAG: hypothetical protein ACTHK7_17945 [Aureliella sp.]